MARPTLPQTDWLGEAWRVFVFLEDIPESPGGLLNPATLTHELIADLEETQDRLTAFINYTLYWRKPKGLPLLRGRRLSMSGREPQTTRGLYKLFAVDLKEGLHNPGSSLLARLRSGSEYLNHEAS